MSATTKVTLLLLSFYSSSSAASHSNGKDQGLWQEELRSLSIEASFLLTFDIFNKTHVLAFRDVDKHDWGVSQEAWKKSHIRNFLPSSMPFKFICKEGGTKTQTHIPILTHTPFSWDGLGCVMLGKVRHAVRCILQVCSLLPPFISWGSGQKC